MNRFTRILTIVVLGLLIPAFTTESDGNETGEHVAILYANDGQAIYRVNPNNGAFITKIAELTRSATVTPTSLTYDWQRRKLYSSTANSEDGTDFVSEIDPETGSV